MKKLYRTTVGTLLASTFLLLMACGGGIAIKRDFKLDPAGNKGIAFMSVTSEGTAADSVDFVTLRLTLTRKADGKTFEFAGIGNRRQVLPPGLGQVIALALEPGDYSLTNWTSTKWNVQPNGSRCEADGAHSAAYDIPFSVKANEVVYLGNLHHFIKIPAMPGQEIDWKLTVADKLARDGELFKTQYPYLAKNTIGGTPKAREQVLKAKTVLIGFCGAF